VPADNRTKAVSQVKYGDWRTKPPSARRAAADLNALFENVDPRTLLPSHGAETPPIPKKAADAVSVGHHPPKTDSKPAVASEPAQAPPPPSRPKRTGPLDPVFWASIGAGAVAFAVLILAVALTRKATEISDLATHSQTPLNRQHALNSKTTSQSVTRRLRPKQEGEGPKKPPALPVNSALTAEELFKKVSPAVVWIAVGDHDHPWGTGSGFLVSVDGLVATNYHVIQGATVASVTFGDGSTHAVEGVLASDLEADLALLKISGQFPHLELAGKDLPPIGSKVYAIGSPRGLINSLSEGLVSGHRPFERTVITMIQTTAAISPGSSGGPLFSADGKVVGVTAGVFKTGTQQSLNRAVPVERLAMLLATRGPLRELASATSQPLYGPATERALKDVWAAIRKSDYAEAMGFTFNRLRRYQEAIASFKTVVALRPDRPGDHAQLGFAYLRAERYQDAVDSFRTAVDLAPDYIEDRYWLGVALHARKSYRESLDVLNAALKLDPKHARIQVEVGRCYQSLHDYQKAMAAMENAISIDPNLADAHYWIGTLHLDLARAAQRTYQSSKMLKERSKAITHLQRAAELDPNGEYGQYARRLLSS
jgi:S1-C subfamily serine protease/Flp pilus assembly protein TadD